KPGKVDHDDDPLTPDIPDPAPADPPVVADGFLSVTEGALAANAELFSFPNGYRENFYWSKHAEKVYASDAGRITIYWRSQTRIREEGGNVFLVKAKTYAVSAGSSKPTQKIYWTEGRFKGPRVEIPAGVVQEVVVIYNSQIPEQVPETEIYSPEGDVNANQVPLPPTTLWFDSTQNLLQAYNKEGRVLIEYLGQPRDPGDASIREHLGYEVVDVIQERAPVKLDLYLGERALPSDGAPAKGDEAAGPDGKRLLDAQLYSSRQVNAGADTGFVKNHEVDGKLAQYAARRNTNANEVQIHWLLPSGEGGLGIEWPSEFNSYLIDWPEQIDGFFALNARPANDSLVRPSAFPLAPGTAPTLLYQDDANGNEASINLAAELEINFLANSDDVNRALLLLSAGDDFWYLRVYSYLEDNVDDLRPLARDQLVAAEAAAQSAVDADPQNGSLQGDLAAAQLLLYRYDNFRKYHVEGVVAVGERIEAPSGADSPAGYISSGDAHNPNAYISPLDTSVPAAEAGAIIPVNVRPGHDTFTIWWYKKISPPSDAFDPIYIPSITGEYTVVWPGEQGTRDVSEIVLAENKGTGDLPPSQQGAALYAQNDPSETGYNPNEEHALKLESRFYALRDDLNVSNANGVVSSKPYVLIEYTNPADGRPGMRAFRVLREKDVNGDNDFDDPGDITFRYNVIAPVALQGPSPLNVMPVPALADGSSANEEVTPSDLDPALNIPDGVLPGRDPSTGQADLSHYNRFTFQDRKGLSW
ncbi:MAG: hypothetical protein MK194_14515, partial [Roseibacillus sp.]|nr:hypothetical protein [Roseibacillus sp.]